MVDLPTTEIIEPFIIGHMGLFFYTKKGSIISTVDLPTTEIIEPQKQTISLPNIDHRHFIFQRMLGLKKE